MVYACLTRKRSGVYPSRSIVAYLFLSHYKNVDLTHIVDEDLRCEILTSLYECYIATGVVNVRLCRELGIGPSLFYNCQMEADFSLFQRNCAEALRQL